MRTFQLTILALFLISCDSLGGTQDIDLSRIRLPEGFEISVYADDVPNARSLVMSPSGTLFVSTRSRGAVYAVVDRDGDHVAERTVTLASGLNMPNGIALRNGSLYVAEVQRILRYDAIEANLETPPDPVVVYDALPAESHHGWRYIGFGPDDKLYVSVGAPCNVCDRGAPYASILRMNPNGTDVEVFATGIRNSVGFTWDPRTEELWFSDNGRDMLGDDVPSDELNYAPRAGMHFGFPYFHEGTIPDPDFGRDRDASDYTPPVARLGAHVASLGLEFYTGTLFPGTYMNRLFVAEHGSWNRSSKVGYRVVALTVDENGAATSEEVFAEGWLQGQDAWGRPVDVEVLADGSMLVSDDQVGAIYRITYTGKNRE